VSWLGERYGLRIGFQCPVWTSLSWLILDFFCPSALLCWEIDGRYHHEDERQRRRDRDRDERLLDECDITTVRYTNAEVWADSFGVALDMVDFCLERLGRRERENPADLFHAYSRATLNPKGKILARLP